MKIEVLGTGCMKCKKLENNVREAVSQMGLDAEVVKVDRIEEIMERGVMMTPAVAVDGNVIVEGKVPTVEKIKKILDNRQ